MALGLSGDNLSEARGNGFRVLGLGVQGFWVRVCCLLMRYRLHESASGLPLGGFLGLRILAKSFWFRIQGLGVLRLRV